MHVVYLCSEYPPAGGGGIGTFTQTLARALVARGHRATAIGFSGDVDREHLDDDEGVAVIRLPAGSVRIAAALSEQRRLWHRVRRLVAAEDVALVEGPELSFWAAPRTVGAPLVLRMHGGHAFFARAEDREPLVVRSRLERRSFARAAHLVAVSRYVGEETSRLLGLRDRRFDVVPNPVDTDRFRPTPTVATEPGRLLFVGTVCEKKGIRQLALAMGDVVDAVPDARLTVAGRDGTVREDGTSFAARVRDAVRPDVRDRVELLGPVDQTTVTDLLARAEVIVLPSHMESFGLTWLEAMAAGKPLVAGNAGPATEVVDDGDSGLLCDGRDPASIAKATIRALTDADLRSRLAAGGRHRAVERFSLDPVLDRNLEVYERIVSTGG